MPSPSERTAKRSGGSQVQGIRKNVEHESGEQKNTGQKNEDRRALIAIFLPAIFLLSIFDFLSSTLGPLRGFVQGYFR
jgi:hypothetical protein